MNNSLQYLGNGEYSVYLESGVTTITKDEIFNLAREISKKEQIPTVVSEFNFKGCWESSIKTMSSAVIDIGNSKEVGYEQRVFVEEKIEDLVDKVIVNAQKHALNYYKNKYIIIDKEG
jgi:hypothetical protein